MALDIWWISGSPYAWWVLLAAEVKGIPYDSHLLSKDRGDLNTREYLAVNPLGRVPVIRDADFILTESMAIVAYLDSKSAATPLFGASPRETARIWEAVSQVLSTLNRDIFADLIMSGRASADDPEPIRRNGVRLKAELGHFEERLADSPYLCGERLSAADIALQAFLHYNLRAATRDVAKNLDLELLPLADRFPRLAAWTSQIERLPGYDRTYPPHWRD